MAPRTIEDELSIQRAISELPPDMRRLFEATTILYDPYACQYVVKSTENPKITLRVNSLFCQQVPTPDTGTNPSDPLRDVMKIFVATFVFMAALAVALFLMAYTA